METKRKKKRTTRLPNGYGSVKKLSGNRRRPWIVSKTDGWETDTASRTVRQKKIIIGYYATRQEALQALADYNKNPYNVEASKITFEEVYNMWSERKYNEVSKSAIKIYRAAFNACTPLYKMCMADIKLYHLQNAVDSSGKNLPTIKNMKMLFSQLFEYAVINEIITKDKNMVSYINIKSAENPNKLNREPFSESEINRLWMNSGDEGAMVVLMLIYSGVRISELLDLKKEDINLSERYFNVRASKTAAGIRTVPIARKTLGFFEHWYNRNGSDYLLSDRKGKHFYYQKYLAALWDNTMKNLCMEHTPHDTRHTCISLLAGAKTYPTTIKKIVGHTGAQTLTEKVYTHLDIKELIEAIDII